MVTSGPQEHPKQNVEHLLVCGGVHSHQQWEDVKVDTALKGEFVGGFAEVHQKYRNRLPEQFRVQSNGHEGSHQFLTDDFVVSSSITGFHLTASGMPHVLMHPAFAAQQSAIQGGSLLPVPDFGIP